eukprot:CAMPEP_0176115952 /NCGR_PEP_ID=MMETSP0120_2-20121206/58232_1 /TAXON_ID=160619 /ORGANISM="Kryptoperidinium foliaceum, Strain CCMP 1326" /LENGTH=138 /DNA_ID=CAMNT_0017450197 /DNA_START=399 /DNA_END=812 /DNA_ORIENTATION=-
MSAKLAANHVHQQGQPENKPPATHGREDCGAEERHMLPPSREAVMKGYGHNLLERQTSNVTAMYQDPKTKPCMATSVKDGACAKSNGVSRTHTLTNASGNCGMCTQAMSFQYSSSAGASPNHRTRSRPSFKACRTKNR